ncbi:phosphate ABC transporter permease subunit PstC [Myceligenerans pegani]|uniref:Phosphate transport system permease protein n=1 Tax=Myceligenerans pegani TaxID=2776917 RepID=A0ABR9N2Q9_9MICO|nr:phosphate ABC transporter permease subunit PstC [Myceligenerans sp. TRM 65318]MBE1877645.1 phosphate ABC transporter permease subunit PstC [Myceligenerans sp. TRM 65318]MBE3019916.1 phosphate ABC transporter permease subunit PstC [Myceligenerans sp. TRM 65318]
MSTDADENSGEPRGGSAGVPGDVAVAELERQRRELRELGLETSPAPRDARVDPTRPLVSRRGWQDNVFRVAAHSGGTLVLLIMTLVGVFLLWRGSQAIDAAGWDFVTEQTFEPDNGRFGIAAVLFGTIVIGVIALSVAVPLALLTATYISEYAPQGIKRFLIGVVDLMAAIPSVVYGLWGAFWLDGNLLPVSEWISTNFGWIPIFAVPAFDPDDPLATPTVFTATAFLAGLVVAMMVAPISTSIMREVFDQAPVGEREGALALGASRWGVIRNVVYPFGAGGIIGGSMLGLGRALGETIAVFMVISPIYYINWHILGTGGNSISALIALRHGEASDFEVSALMAAGLVLFLITMLVNFVAGFIIQRSRSGAAS